MQTKKGMRVMKYLWIILLLIGSWNVCLAKGVKLTKLKVSTAKKVKIPKTINLESYRFKKTESHTFKERSLGSSVTYEAEELPELAINLYVYPMDHGVSAEHLMAYEFHLLKNQLNQVYEYKEFKPALLIEELVTFGEKEAFYSKHTFQDEKGALISESYLTNKKLHYVKIRMSFPAYQAEQLQPISHQIAQMLIKNIEVTEKKKSKLQVQMTVFEDNEELNSLTISNQLIYSVALLNQLSKDDMILSFEDIKKAIELVVKINTEKLEQEKKELTNFFTISEIAKADLIDEFIWKTQHQPHWQQPDQLDLDQLDTWLENQKDKIFVPFAGDQLIGIYYHD